MLLFVILQLDKMNKCPLGFKSQSIDAESKIRVHSKRALVKVKLFKIILWLGIIALIIPCIVWLVHTFGLVKLY